MKEPLSLTMELALDEIVLEFIAKADPAVLREAREEYAETAERTTGQVRHVSKSQSDKRIGSAAKPPSQAATPARRLYLTANRLTVIDWTFTDTARRNGIAPSIDGEDDEAKRGRPTKQRKAVTLSDGVGVILSSWTIDADDLSPAAKSVIGRLPGQCRNVDCDGGRAIAGSYCHQCATQLTYVSNKRTAVDRMVRQATKAIIAKPSARQRRFQQMRTVAVSLKQAAE